MATTPSVIALLLAASTASAAITIDTVFVGDAGNANDTTTGYGAVAYDYHIGTHEVTNSQYTAFLNAVAATNDTHSLYNSEMGTSAFGGISRSGTAGSYSYSTRTGMADKPVNFVSFWDSARFANWLTNGQPTGAQGSGTTETGAYTLTSNGISSNTVTRGDWYNASEGNTSSETVFAIASEDEWYKAAYYDPTLNGGTGGYYVYPTQRNTAPTAQNPPGGENSANYNDFRRGTTDVGAYPHSASHYGTFDQGGNVFEWNDEIVTSSTRGLRGGSFLYIDFNLQSSFRAFDGPASDSLVSGFRVSSLAPIP